MEFLEDKEDLDNKGMYIYEFYDDMDESLRKRFSILGNEAYWYPFINDPKEVQRFEIEFQNLLAERQSSLYSLFATHFYTLELKNKTQKAVNKFWDGNNKKESNLKDEGKIEIEEEEKRRKDINQEKKEVDQVIY